MPMYAVSLVPLIQSLSGIVHQVWYTDDAAACGSLSHLKKWWSSLCSSGRPYGYNGNALKTWLLVKDHVSVRNFGP